MEGEPFQFSVSFLSRTCHLPLWQLTDRKVHAQAEVGWMHKEVMVMGRLVMQPRLVAYQADDPGLAYTYSRLTLTPDAWSPAVLAIKVRPCENDEIKCLASQVAVCHVGVA